MKAFIVILLICMALTGHFWLPLLFALFYGLAAIFSAAVVALFVVCAVLFIVWVVVGALFR